MSVALLVLAFASAACRRKEPASAAAPARGDIVLVTLDTVRADALGFAGNTRVKTPGLDALAREGRVFTNAHAHNVVTLPSHVNILTGLYPFRHGVRDNAGPPLDARFATAATLLSGAGFTTGAFVGAFPLDARWGLTRGFDVYDDRYGKGTASVEFAMAERPASQVVAAALEWYRRPSAKPRFLWVHLYDAHAPYAPPPPFDAEYALEPYLGEVAALDAALAPLLDAVRARPGALVAVTADHGEALGDHGEETHGLFAYESTLHVPLLLWGRGVAAGVDARPARHVDILPTLLTAAGVTLPAGLDGASLLEAPPSRSASYFEALSASLNRGWAPLRGVVDGTKYIDLPIPELYDLPADPREERNLAPADPRTRELARLIPREAYAETARAAVSSEDAAKLRSLGYVAGSAAPKRTYGPEDDPKRLVTLDALLHRAIDLYQSGKLDDAIAVARDLVKRRPDMAVAYEHLAFLLQEKGDPGAAAAALRAAAARGIASEKMTARLALVLCEAGKPKEALTVLAPLSASRDPDTLDALGIASSDAGLPEAAYAAFRRALELDPTHVAARQDLGIAYLKAGDAGRARTELEAAVERNDRLAPAWNALGVARAHLGDVDGALDAWKTAYGADARQREALFNYALLAAKSGRTADARSALETLAGTARDNSERRRAEDALRTLGDAR